MTTPPYKHIYYRGSLDACNYSCGYCPFAKKVASIEAISQDKAALERFIQFLAAAQTGLNVFIVPYGEALIYDYYLEAIAKVSSWKHIEKIGIQTNNSFNLSKLLDYMRQYNGSLAKIRLWCTYHPTQISGEKFITQCNGLYKGEIPFSVGAVADGTQLTALTYIRRSLPSDIYMWLNKLDGLNRPYTSDEINTFLNIDPFFELQLTKFKSDTTKCTSGRDSVFMDYAGNISACNVSRCVIGNIYKEVKWEIKCRSSYCRCYLAYANRADIPWLARFQEETLYRILPPNPKSAYFFDIDGTLLDSHGKMSDTDAANIKALSEESYIFLNTALPMKRAYAKCRKIWRYIHGGVFSNGADIRIFEYNYQRIIPMEDSLLTMLNCIDVRYFADYDSGKLHKALVMHGSAALKEVLSEYSDKYNISREKAKTIITDIHASKLNGALFICRFYHIPHHKVYAFGNSENDRETIEYFSAKQAEKLA